MQHWRGRSDLSERVYGSDNYQNKNIPHLYARCERRGTIGNWARYRNPWCRWTVAGSFVRSPSTSASLSSTSASLCLWQVGVDQRLYCGQEWALPLYGYLMPVLVAFTVITNSFIVLVLAQKHLRTPTNFVLLSMAITDLLTGFFIHLLLTRYQGSPHYRGLSTITRCKATFSTRNGVSRLSGAPCIPISLK